MLRISPKLKATYFRLKDNDAEIKYSKEMNSFVLNLISCASKMNKIRSIYKKRTHTDTYQLANEALIPLEKVIDDWFKQQERK